MIDLPLILNPKTLDPRDESSPPVYQVESAMGAAISLFDGTAAVEVPRTRFYPIKTCNDLLIVRSDCFVYTDNDDLQINPARDRTRQPDAAEVRLDPKFYKKIEDLNERFADGIPSLVDCDSLTIEGDVKFEKNVTIRNAVTIRNTRPFQAVVKEGSVVNEDLVF